MAPDPPLTDAERVVLNVVMAPGSRSINCTVQAIGDRSGLGTEEAGRVLRALQEREPSLVREDGDEGLGVRFYMSTFEAADAMEFE